MSFPKLFFGKGKAMSSHVIRKDRRQPESVRIKSAKGGMNDDVLKETAIGHFEQNASDHFEQDIDCRAVYEQLTYHQFENCYLSNPSI